MRVLIISHNVFSESNNMGKTLLSYFRDFSPGELAEFYIQEKEPLLASPCRDYFRVTDREALLSLFGKRVGTAFRLEESRPEPGGGGNGLVESVRRYGEKRSPFVYLVRNAVWALARWQTRELTDWLRAFDPELLFFMSGDFAFMYTISLRLQKLLQKPLAVCCVDDFYLYNRNEGSLPGRLQQRAFLRAVRRTMAQASCLFTISDSMKDAYQALFGKPCHVLHTSARERAPAPGHGKRIAYFGNLLLGRGEALAEIGRAVKRLGLDGVAGIDVYSGEKNPENLAMLTEENGVFFHGAISLREVEARMDGCMAVLHTESFDPALQKLVRYSVSTKLADSLLNGPCLIAYGPEGLASIDYLKANGAAYVISRPEALESGLREILTDAALRERIVRSARALARRNHDEAVNSGRLRAWLEEAIAEGPGDNG